MHENFTAGMSKPDGAGPFLYSSAPPPYTQPAPVAPQSREERYRTIVNKYEISNMFSAKLQKLNSFKIVFIFDDSGSMNATLQESPLNTGLLKVIESFIRLVYQSIV